MVKYALLGKHKPLTKEYEVELLFCTKNGGIKMNFQEAQAKVEKLREELNEHNYRYYVLDSPTITDAEYDRLMRANCYRKRISRAYYSDSPKELGCCCQYLSSYRHRKPLLSLSCLMQRICKNLTVSSFDGEGTCRIRG